MGKYSPLGDFLRRQRADLVPMTFAEIERVIGDKLPENSPQYPAWWSNNPTNNVMTKVWLSAGFKTEQVDVNKRKVVFRRVRVSAKGKGTTAPAAEEGEKPFHPAWGAMQGMIRIMPGTDLTQPADPEWAARLDAQYGPELRKK